MDPAAALLLRPTTGQGRRPLYSGGRAGEGDGGALSRRRLAVRLSGGFERHDVAHFPGKSDPPVVVAGDPDRVIGVH